LENQLEASNGRQVKNMAERQQRYGISFYTGQLCALRGVAPMHNAARLGFRSVLRRIVGREIH
jgi:hypothetical protein